jgi:hypothetical protein
MGGNPLEIDEINELINAVDERLESLRVARDVLDKVKDAEAYREIEAQIRGLTDQQRILSKRWRELAEGFLPKE